MLRKSEIRYIGYDIVPDRIRDYDLIFEIPGSRRTSLPAGYTKYLGMHCIVRIIATRSLGCLIVLTNSSIYSLSYLHACRYALNLHTAVDRDREYQETRAVK